MLVVYAASDAYRIPLIFDGRPGLHGTSPIVIVADLFMAAFLVGALLPAFAVARMWALGPWSMPPLVLLLLGTVLWLILLRTGLPIQNLPQALGEGPDILLVVHAPEPVRQTGLVRQTGWPCPGGSCGGAPSKPGLPGPDARVPVKMSSVPE
jgi:hypothetical protein